MDGFGLGWMHGMQEGEVMMQHGGGYVGTSTHFSFMPELGIGVVILTNSSMGGGALVEVVREDIYAQLLAADQSFDRLPRLVDRVRSRRALPEEAESLGANPARAEGGLSLDVKSYVGLYRDVHWGDLELSWDGEALQGRMGNLPVSVHTLGPDSFALHTQISDDWEVQVLIENGQVLALEPLEAGEAPSFQRVP